MSQMSQSAVRVIDPVLTTLAQGYSDPEFVGDVLFPAVPVEIAGGQIIEFGKESFKLYTTQRAPGTHFKRVQFGYLGKPYALENHGLEVALPSEHVRDAQKGPGIDLSSRAVSLNLSVNKRSLEVQQAGLATNPANYAADSKVALAGTSKWSDPASKPITQIAEYRETIRAKTGRYPNTALFSALAWKAFINNPEVLDRIKFTQTGIVTTELAAVLLQIPKIKIGLGVLSNDSNVNTDIWGNNCVLAYTSLGKLGAEEPSYGYTYTLTGHPAVDAAYYEKPSNSWIHQLRYERSPVLSGISAGFLVQAPN